MIEELFDDLVNDPRARWSAVAAIAILWLTAAWGEPIVLLLLLVPASVWWLARRAPLIEDPELSDLL